MSRTFKQANNSNLSYMLMYMTKTDTRHEQEHRYLQQMRVVYMYVYNSLFWFVTAVSKRCMMDHLYVSVSQSLYLSFMKGQLG